MVPARNLQLLRDAHATPAFIAALTAHPHHHMAQEPIDQAPPKPLPPPQQQEVPQDQEERRQAVLPPPQQHLQPAAGTSGSSSGGSSSNGGGGGAGDWLRLGLGPASPSPGAAAPEIDLFLAPAPRHGHDVRDSMGMPPGAFARPGVHGIPQASIQMPVPRAGPPWMPPWSPAAAQQPSLQLLPFGHRGFYGPGSPAASSSGFETIRVVLPPPAATAAAPGVWFVLQAAPHQEREPFLPQIPRSYLRIKDARVTVRLLIKYLVNKLRLEDESEVEITCRARPLLPFMTLQHVRDTIWCQRDAVSPSVSADMSTADHIMVLQYGRRP